MPAHRTSLHQEEHPGIACDAAARFSDADLELLSRHDLLPLATAAGIPPDGLEHRLGSLQDHEVALLARILRRSCQRRMDAFSALRGQRGIWVDDI